MRITCAEEVVSAGGRAKPIGTAFLREALAPPRDPFVQDVRIHWTVISMAHSCRVVEGITIFMCLTTPSTGPEFQQVVRSWTTAPQSFSRPAANVGRPGRSSVQVAMIRSFRC
jgi:hypothetical protein